MPKLDFFALERPLLRKETRTFVEPRFKQDRSKDVTFTLQALDTVQWARVSELADATLLAYEGDPESNKEPTKSFYAVGNKIPRLNRTILLQAAIFCLMQCPDNSEDRYSIEEVIAFSVQMPKVWAKIGDWRTDLNHREENEPGEDEPANPITG